MDETNSSKFHSSTRRSIYINPQALSFQAPSSATNPSQIKDFYKSLPNFAPTPLIPLKNLAAELGVQNVFVKAETSRLGLPSFKLLGASWAIRQAIIQRAELNSAATLEDLCIAAKKYEIKLCAATDGNHGRAVARMGKMLGIEVTKIFVPRGLDESIIASIASEGADVIVVDGDYDETVRVAHAWGEETVGGMLIEGTAFVGYEDIPRWTVEGYTTMLHEIDDQLQEKVPTLILAPVGVGSLSEAIVTHYKNGRGNTAVATVEPDTAASLHQSLKAGISTTIKTSPSIMTGLECGTISTAAWPVLRDGVDASITVSDLEVHEAIQYLATAGISSGPCGAASLAGFRRLMKEKTFPALGHISTVILICTEGTQPYQIPQNVTEDDPHSVAEILTQITSSAAALEEQRRRVVSFIAQYIEYRDIEIHYMDTQANNSVPVALIPGKQSTTAKSLLVCCYIDPVHIPIYDMDLSDDGEDADAVYILNPKAVRNEYHISMLLNVLSRSKDMNFEDTLIVAFMPSQQHLRDCITSISDKFNIHKAIILDTYSYGDTVVYYPPPDETRFSGWVVKAFVSSDPGCALVLPNYKEDEFGVMIEKKIDYLRVGIQSEGRIREVADVLMGIVRKVCGREDGGWESDWQRLSSRATVPFSCEMHAGS